MDEQIDFSLKKRLLDIINRTKKNQASKHFRLPVDYELLQLHDYLNIIKRPMDLETLASNLRASHYHKFGDFLLDLSLIFSNCRRYNYDNQVMQDAAESCEQVIFGYIQDEFDLNRTEYEQIRDQTFKLGEGAIFTQKRLFNLLQNINKLNKPELWDQFQIKTGQNVGAEVILDINKNSLELEELESQVNKMLKML
ncbi:Bromodomain-containing_protein [Hexamita inflata]|uniref:Bromodomain-containing protein n=1 Tax=Hexamita inflata TaxID=28002 RepID=A0AA86PLL3_9EUKA|nr:Bromodomain-containing protein [Hexamita inflata]